MSDNDQLKIIYMPLGEVQRLDGNPKSHDIGSIVASILKHGFKDPPKLEPALNNGRGGIVEGNGRTEALLVMREGKFDAPRGIIEKDGDWLVPVLVGVDSTSAIEAKAYALDHNNLSLMGGDLTALDTASMYDREAYLEMLVELNHAGEKVLSVDGDDLDLLLSTGSSDDWSEDDEEGDDEEGYSRKIEPPIYEPTGDKPSVHDLYNDSRTKELLSEIENAELPEDEKEFLRVAAHRHTVLNFSKIANYYAHSDANIQELMENNALVIVDFDKAVELGFVRLTEKLLELTQANESL